MESVKCHGLHNGTSTSPVYEYGINDVGYCCRREAVGRLNGILFRACEADEIRGKAVLLQHPSRELLYHCTYPPRRRFDRTCGPYASFCPQLAVTLNMEQLEIHSKV